MNKREIEKSLKRFLKRKIGYSFAILVAFMITGEISLSVEENSQINAQKLAETKNEKSIERSEGKSWQFFFSTFFEKRKAKKYDSNNFIGRSGNGNTKRPDLNIPEQAVTPRQLEVNTPEMPDITITEPEFTFRDPADVRISGIHNGVSIDINAGNINVVEIDKENMNVNQAVTTPTLPGDIKMEIEMEDITETETSVVAPEIELGYDPHLFTAPNKIIVDTIEVPESFYITPVVINGKGFSQNQDVGIIDSSSTLNSVIQNYTSYKPTGDMLNIQFSQNDISYGKTAGVYGVDDDGEVGEQDENDRENLITLNESANRTALRNYFDNKDGDNNTDVTAFITDLIDDDVTLEGVYNIKYEQDSKPADRSDYIKIFLSVNPAGVWNNNYDGTESVTTKITEIKEGTEINLSTKDKENTTFNGKLIALEHQIYDRNHNKVGDGDDPIPDAYMESSSVLLNNGTINLGASNEDGTTGKEYSKNMIGIMIDLEENNKRETTGENGSGEATINNKTINNGTININGTNSIGISFEEYLNQSQYEQNSNNSQADEDFYLYKGHFVLRDDAYIGNINVKGTNNYAFKMGNIFDELPDYNEGTYRRYTSTYKNMYKYEFATYFDKVKIIGTDGTINIEDKDNPDNDKSIQYQSKVVVDGEKNAGLVIGKSLSSNARDYEGGKSLGLTDEAQGTGSNDRWDIHLNNPNAYTDDLINEILSGGTVNPIANFEGIKIEVGGTNNIGFIRDKDYSDNNKNDMSIDDKNITDIHFANGAKNSVLIRAEQYGISMDRDFQINFEGAQTKADDDTTTTEENYKNIVMQATAQTWEKEYEYNKSNTENSDVADNKQIVNSVGTVKNNQTISGTDLKNVVVMMASGYAEGLNDGMYDGLGVGNTNSDPTQEARIFNNGKIEVTGSGNIGMAVLDNNKGFLGTDKDGNNLTGDKVVVSVLESENPDENNSNENISNTAIYNTGTFNIGNAQIKVSGRNSVGIYNAVAKYETTKDGVLTGTEENSAGAIKINEGTEISVSNNAIGIYSSGGTVTADNGLILNYSLEDSSRASDENNIGTGIYALDGAKVNLTGQDTDGKSNLSINIENGAMGIGAIGKDTSVTINNGDIVYSGNGYALYADEEGSITLDSDSTLTLEGDAYGVYIDTAANGQINLNGAEIIIGSNDVTIASAVDRTGSKKYNSSSITTDLNIGTFTINSDSADEYKGYKIAAIDGGEIYIDGDNNGTINPADTEANMEFLKKYKFQRVKLTLNDNQTVDMTIDNDIADTYFGGEVTGLGTSASNITGDSLKLEDTSITLGENSKVIADRTEQAVAENGTEKSSVGVYMNYGVVTLENGSSIVVENETESDDNHVQGNGVGIFAVNGSKVDVAQNAEITVHGNNAVGIFAQSFTSKDENGNNIFGKDETGSSITNAGNITLTGKGTVGIYIDNNNGKDKDNETNDFVEYNENSKITISNSGNITVGGVLSKDGEDISSVGIYGINTNISNTGTITAGSNDNEAADSGAIGIYAEKSNVTNIGSLVLGDNATGVYIDKDSTISNTADITITSMENKTTNITNTTRRVGIMLDGGEDGKTSSGNEIADTTINFGIDMSGVIGGKAIVAENRDVTLALGKAISVSGENGRGIRISDGTATNSGTINLTTNGNPKTTSGSVGMLAVNQNGVIDNKGTINVDSDYGTGIYISNEKEDSKNSITTIGNININSANHGTGVVVKGYGEVAVNGNTFGQGGITFGANTTNSVGIYAVGTNAKINVSGDVTVTLANQSTNALLYAEDGATVNNNGNITITKTDSGTASGNVAVFLGAGGKYAGTGTVTAKNDSIGLYANAAKGTTLEKINITADGNRAIGVVLAGEEKTTTQGGTTVTKGSGTVTGTITLKNTQTSDTQSTGLYLTQTDLSSIDLTVNHGEGTGQTFTGGSNGTALYVGENSSIKDGKIVINGNGLADNSGATSRSVGVYYADETASNNVAVTINKANTIGVYGQKTLTQNNDVALNADNGVGVFVNKAGAQDRGTITLSENKTISINSGSKNIGIAGVNTDITNNGTVTIGEKSTSGTAVLVGTNSTFTNDGTINVNEGVKIGSLGIGIYLGNGSQLLKAGTVNVSEGNAAVYTTGTVAVKSDIDVKNNSGVMGVIAGNGSVVNGIKADGTKSVISIGAESTGIYSLGDITIENVKVASTDEGKNKLSLGMYLADDETGDEEHTINNSEIEFKEGIGIGVASSENHTNTLNISGTKITIDSGKDDSETSEKGIGIYLGTNGKLVNGGGNTLDITNGIGIYGKEGSEINIGSQQQAQDTINLKGYSLGVYADKGTITIGSNTNVTVGTEAEGSLAYGINSGITNGANITAAGSKNFMGLFAKYTNALTDPKDAKTITNTGDINISGEQSYGIVVINGTWENGQSTDDENDLANEIINSGNITVSGKVTDTQAISAGIYTEGSSITNSGIISAGDATVGVAYNNLSPSTKHNITLNDGNGEIKLTGTRGIGVSLQGTAGDVSIGNISIDTTKNSDATTGNLGLYLKNFEADDFSVGTITLGTSSLGIYSGEGTSVNVGDVTISAGDDSMGVAGIGSSTAKSEITLGANSKITVGAKGTGIYSGTNATVNINDFSGITVGTDGVIAHADGGTIHLADLSSNNDELSADGHIGLIVSNGGNITADNNGTLSKISVSNGGIGMVIKGENAATPDIINGTTIELGGNTTDSKYSVGMYYQQAGSIDSLRNVNIEFKDDAKQSAALVFDRTYGTFNTGGTINVNKGTDNIGIIVRRSEIATDDNGAEKEKSFNLVSNINVEGTGNIGLAGRNSIINMTGDITTGAGSSGSHYPIGVYLLGDNENIKHGFTQTGNITVGTNSTGIYGKNYDITVTGDIEAANGGIGIFADSDNGNNISLTGDSITVASSTAGSNSKTVGIYGGNNNISVDLNNGTMTVGNNGSIGVYSIGNGDIEFTGNAELADGTYQNGAYGIYKTSDDDKVSNGTITVNSGNWNVGAYSYGIVARAGNANSRFTIENSADMTLGESAVGISSFGINELTNTGNITVGNASVYPSGENAGEINPSVAIYMVNGFGDGDATGTNTGDITVGNGSVGIYTLGYVDFTNGGTINVSNGGTGVLAGLGAQVTNTGTINVSGEGSVGMRAEGAGTVVRNNGTIDVSNGGTGVIVTDDASFVLAKGGTLKIDGTSYGVRGTGTFVNNGNIEIGEGGIVQDESIENSGAIVVTENEVILNKNYHVADGILKTDLDVKANGMVVDISNGNGLGIDSDNISGDVTLDSKFILTGNGINYEVENFVTAGNEVDVNTSKLYNSSISEEGTLQVTKNKYANIMNNERFNNFYNAIDSRLSAGNDAEVLRGMAFHLNRLGETDAFNREAQRITSEMQGDIYGTVQSRMRDINKAFDNSFDEMAEAYNPSVNNNKISLIQGYGENKNSNYDMIDYEYTITGLQYMQQYQGLNSDNKYGYQLGFAVSQFEFDDFGSSEEDVYSLRAGVHNIKKFENGMTLLSKAEIGYNRHDVERKVNYGYGSYTNDADFNSYEVSIDNKLSKPLYEKDDVRFGVYTGLNLEYGRFDDIDETGNIAIKVKGNDYLSSKAMVGFDGSYTTYFANDWAVKLTGDIGYSYDFGENYKENEAKVKGENEGYYSLLSDVETKGEAGARIGVTFKKSETMAVTLEGEYTKDFERDENYWKAGLRFTYKFNSDDYLAVLKNPMGFMRNHFDFDSDVLRENEKEAIEKTSELINKKKVKGTLVIEGHADSTGRESYNQTLSEKRANNVQQEFTKNIKKPENIQYEVRGYGETKPVESNDTPEGRAENRRVDVRFVNQSNKK